MALRLITCSPRRTALLPPSRPEKLLPPGALTPAPRRRDHTSLPYALMPFAIGTASVHRDPPHDRGDHDTPLWSGRDGCYVAVIWGSEKQKYFRFARIFPLTRFPKTGSRDLPRLRQPPSSEGGLRRVERLRRARPSGRFAAGDCRL